MFVPPAAASGLPARAVGPVARERPAADQGRVAARLEGAADLRRLLPRQGPRRLRAARARRQLRRGPGRDAGGAGDQPGHEVLDRHVERHGDRDRPVQRPVDQEPGGLLPQDAERDLQPRRGPHRPSARPLQQAHRPGAGQHHAGRVSRPADAQPHGRRPDRARDRRLGSVGPAREAGRRADRLRGDDAGRAVVGRPPHPGDATQRLSACACTA